MRPYILAENNWKHLNSHRYDLAILPWGATEAHNYHLPYGTDIYEADYIAAESARLAYENGANVVVLPTVPFGVNTGQRDIYLDLNLNPTTQLAILKDLVTVLNRQGLHKLLILNSHGGNNFKPLIRELGYEFPDMFIAFCNWFQALDRSKYFDHSEGDHADEMETSILLHIQPQLVLPLEEAGPGIGKKWKIEALNENWAWAERQWSKVTEDTGIGDPRKATAEKGQKYLISIVEKVSQLMVEIAQCDTQDIYK